MASSQRGVAVSEGLKRSADARQCEVCGRRGAIVTIMTDTFLSVYCRWAREGKCDRPDHWRT